MKLIPLKNGGKDVVIKEECQLLEAKCSLNSLFCSISQLSSLNHKNQQSREKGTIYFGN